MILLREERGIPIIRRIVGLFTCRNQGAANNQEVWDAFALGVQRPALRLLRAFSDEKIGIDACKLSERRLSFIGATCSTHADNSMRRKKATPSNYTVSVPSLLRYSPPRDTIVSHAFTVIAIDSMAAWPDLRNGRGSGWA